MSIRVLIADDFAPFRKLISWILQDRPGLRIVSEASDGEQLVWKAQELQPDLILIDIGLPQLNGIEAARRIRKLSPSSKMIFVSQESSVDIVQAVLAIGACGYVVKTDAASDLLAAVDSVLLGNKFVGARFAGHDLGTKSR